MKRILCLFVWLSVILCTAPWATAQFTFIPRSAPDWRYLDNGSDQGTAWTQPSFDDLSWPLGTAEFGYGDGDEATVVSFGPDPLNRYVTTYFRKHFWVTNSAQWSNLVLRLVRDDGAVVYLNGTEIARHNMPAGAVDYQTLATATVNAPDESTFFEQFLSPALLVSGQNTIAVEIHQVNPSSSDISFNLELVGIAAGGATRPTIISQPQSQTVPEGSDVTFSVTATGTQPLRYRWRRNGASLPGATNSTLTLFSVTASNAGNYSVIVSNIAGFALSSNAVLTVVTPTNAVPVVTWLRPTNGSTFPEGSTILMTARATDSDGTVSFVDFFADSMNLGRVVSSTNIYNFVWSNAPSGTFQLRAEAVDNAGGRGISDSVQITVGPPNTNTPPSIVTQPQSQTVPAGSDVTFSVVATGTEPLSYRWRRNGATIPGATNSTLTLFNVSSTNAGNYTVVVTNIAGIRLSSNAVLTVISPSNMPPVVTLTNPTNGQVFLARQPILLRAQASDPDGTVSFVDFFANTTRVARAFSSTGTFSGVWSNAPAGNHQIRAVATDNQGAQASSAPASITVISNRPPTAFGQSVTVQEDSSVLISLTASDPDGDSLIFTILTLPAHGTLSGFAQSPTYTPHPDYFGPDSFTFSVRDRQFESAPATVEITVSPVNDAPIARIQIENTVTFLDSPTIITLDPSALIILNGSQSSDIENDPLTHTWLFGEPPVAFATGVRVTNEVATGSFAFQLDVSDGELIGTDQASVDVLMPCDAIALLVLRIEESSHPNAIIRPLIDELDTSCNHFDKGRIGKAVESLESFQEKAVDKLGDIDPALAELLIEAAQTLIDAVSIEQVAVETSRRAVHRSPNR